MHNRYGGGFEKPVNLWGMLYAADLVISPEMLSKSIEKFYTWNNALQKRGIKINVDKTKIFQARSLLLKETKSFHVLVV